MINRKKFEIPFMGENIWVRPELCSFFSDLSEDFAVIQAGKGAGKTSVFAKLAGCCRQNVFWYSMEKSDNDIEMFCEGLAEMEKKLVQAEKACLVLDNVQEFVSPDCWHELLSRFLEKKSAVKLVFLTNRELPEWILTLLLSGRGKMLGEESFRLTPKEAAEWFGRKDSLAPELIAKVTEDLCGWSLGITYILNYLQGEGSSFLQRPEDGSISLDWEELLNESLLSRYLDEVFWRHCDLELRTLMEQTAVLGTFSWKVCREVLPKETKERTYRRLVQNKLWLYHSKEKGTYSYCRMFQVYLLGMTDRVAKNEICQKAAVYHMEQKQYRQMTYYAVQGGQKELLAGVMERYGAELLHKDRETLGKMLCWLEGKAAVLSPECCGIAAQYDYSIAAYEKMEFYLNKADSSFGKENKFGCYRSLYRGLLKYEEDSEKYGRQIHHALFFLRESGLSLPFLMEKEQRCLEDLTKRDEQQAEEQSCLLSVTSFGNFSVTASKDGRVLSWRTRKGSELFAYLTDLQGAAVERRQLLEILWREEMPANAVSMLHNMIYNIRKELADYRLEGMISYKNRKYSLDVSGIAWDGERINRLALLVEKGDVSALLGVRNEFSSYWGRYLEDFDNYWIEEKQGYYDEIFKRGCEILAGQLLKEGDFGAAALYYRNILKLEPYSEEAATGLVAAYGERREWQKVKQCYEGFCRLLEQDLGLRPGKDFVNTYHRYLE